MWMREATRREKLPEIKDLSDPQYFPYRYGQALWAFIGGKYGDRAVGDLLRAAIGRSGYDGAFKQILGVDAKELSAEWHAAEFAAYRPIAETTKMPAAFATAVITRDGNRGQLNVSPEVSPDGSRIMFFSERDLFSIDLYLADARTGKVIRKITDTATDPHFESLQFLSSAGAWDSASKRFVFPGISKGEPVLTIVNVENGKREREIRLTDLHEVLNPTWSPDGNVIAFSGLVGGLTDLFAYDLTTSTLRRLTTDAFAELDPAWSPDGRSLAFSTDRFTSKLAVLEPGLLRIAILDIASGQVREVGGFDGAKNISPQWSSDGRSLYFLSDRQGITNLYRLEVAGGVPAQLTNLLTGVSGITALSPALSAGGGRVVFSAYEEDGYNIYALEGAQLAAATAPIDLPLNAGVLPPRRAGEGPIFTALNDPVAGLPPEPKAPPLPYKSSFSLDYAGQPTIGVGADPFGTYASGGVAFLFSDTLGNHVVATTAQVTSRFDEFGGSAFYLNRTHRWNWGIGVDSTPYVSRAYETGFGNSDGQPRLHRTGVSDPAGGPRRFGNGLVSVQQRAAVRSERGRQADFAVAGRHRARVRSVRAADQRGRDRTGAELGAESRSTASAALVYDTSISGITSPIRGTRYRLELSQTGGIDQLLGRARRRPDLLDAGASVHVRLARALLRPLRKRGAGPTPADAVSRLSRTGSRLRAGIVRVRRVRRAAQRIVPGVRSAERKPRGRRERGAAVPAVGRIRRQRLLRSHPGRARGVLRRRRRLGPVVVLLPDPQ